ncbi:hypothetical protein BDF20DRAFT_828242 [Mycotypha africana]|uniref:uncharacterized protein n=1 Tax=Mycotypha africana TaxID=64632 RepID=UPI0023018EB2|nr:uncharacterized protein BDF20DRAFT_828242 [Mycotypha africana]KAI8968193.1 hypothetical protein BDF20DRAFT_828242 [Mycotypha africana]
MDCLDSSNQASIAETFPTVSFLMVDLSDNMTRMYAQPLLKQFGNLTAKPAWSRYDIEAQFNSETNWYYPTDDGPIGSNQIDFLGNVIHELIHGLGLMTSWGDIFFRHLAPLFPDNVLEYFITPSLLASMDKAQSLNDYSSSQPFWGFVEFAFDKFLAYKTKRFNTTDGSFHSLSSTTTRLNKFAQSNTLFRTAVDFANAWYHSESYEHAKRAYGRAVTALEISAIVNNEPIFWMETSLDPFSPGSSLCHVDQSQYANTSDYLMIYSAQQGISSTSLTTRYPYGPIGPRLAKMMAALGYRMDPKYAATTIRPQLRFWSPPLQLVGTESNPSPTAAIDRSGPARLPPTASAGTDPTALAGVSPTKSDALSLHFSIYHWFIASLTTIITIFYL